MPNQESRASGKIILLNGPSSSGKSTLARAVQARLDEPFWHISIDHLRDAGVLPSARIHSGEFSWRAMRDAFFNGFEHSLVAYVRCGNNLIVEYIMESEAWLLRLALLLQGHDVFFVGLRCDLAELERREIARGDRALGDARRDYFTVHGYCRYDIELNSAVGPEANAERLIAAWHKRDRPGAFARLAAEKEDASFCSSPSDRA